MVLSPRDQLPLFLDTWFLKEEQSLSVAEGALTKAIAREQSLSPGLK